MPPKPGPSDSPLHTGGVIDNRTININLDHFCGDDYAGVFYNREPTINHHHYTLDGSAVIFHDHDNTANHGHNYEEQRNIDIPEPSFFYYDVSPAHYDDNNICVHYADGKHILVNDPRFIIRHNHTDYRGN